MTMKEKRRTEKRRSVRPDYVRMIQRFKNRDLAYNTGRNSIVFLLFWNVDNLDGYFLFRIFVHALENIGVPGTFNKNRFEIGVQST